MLRPTLQYHTESCIIVMMYVMNGIHHIDTDRMLSVVVCLLRLLSLLRVLSCSAQLGR